MTPEVRIVALFVVAAALPFLPPVGIAAAAAVVAAGLAAAPRALRAEVVRGVWRVRWLVLAVAVLFVFLSPGDDWRFVEALARAGVLVCAVAAVRFALHGIAPDRLAQAVVRFAPRRFAHRLVLTLDAVPEVQALIARTPAPGDGRPLSRLMDRAAAVIAAIEREGARA